jgi:hypothetical protein
MINIDDVAEDSLNLEDTFVTRPVTFVTVSWIRNGLMGMYLLENIIDIGYVSN